MNNERTATQLQGEIDAALDDPWRIDGYPVSGAVTVRSWAWGRLSSFVIRSTIAGRPWLRFTRGASKWDVTAYKTKTAALERR